MKLEGNRGGALSWWCFSSLSRKDLVRVEATVIEKTESWPKINMKFRKRKNFRKKKSKCETVYWSPVLPAHHGCAHVPCQVAGQCQGNVIVPALCGIRSAPGLSHCPIATCRPQSSCDASMAATLLGYSSGIFDCLGKLEAAPTRSGNSHPAQVGLR